MILTHKIILSYWSLQFTIIIILHFWSIFATKRMNTVCKRTCMHVHVRIRVESVLVFRCIVTPSTQSQRNAKTDLPSSYCEPAHSNSKDVPYWEPDCLTTTFDLSLSGHTPSPTLYPSINKTPSLRFTHAMPYMFTSATYPLRCTPIHGLLAACLWTNKQNEQHIVVYM